jgi:hypothetical protein
VAEALQGCHLLTEEVGDNMTSRDALGAQLPDAPHCSSKLAIVRIKFLPICLANQKGAGLGKKGIRLRKPNPAPVRTRGILLLLGHVDIIPSPTIKDTEGEPTGDGTTRL